MSTDQQLAAVLTDLADVLDAIDPAQDQAPTPCTEWDVTALRTHVVSWLSSFTDGFEDAQGRTSDPAVVSVQGRGGDQVRSLAARLSVVLPEAMSRPLFIGEASMPGDMSASMILWEYQMHGWDLARATGQSWNPPADGVSASLKFAPMMLSDDFRGDGKPFGPAIDAPSDATDFDRLLALSGRDPHWGA